MCAQVMSGFPNLAGNTEADAQCAGELALAKIEVYPLPESTRESHPEMRTIIMGSLGNWSFKRAWRYWIATGAGIPPDIATELHEAHGKEVRVEGHCGCPSPLEWHKGFAVGMYHVDTQEGLNALSRVIRQIQESNS
jgi:hypothetical protein